MRTRDGWVAVAVLLLVAACGDRGGATTDAGPAGATDRGSGRDAVAGADLLQQVRAASFGVVYDVVEPNGDAVEITVASSPPAFAWRESDEAGGRKPTFARHLIQPDQHTIEGCIWVGARLDDPEAWECASSAPAADGGLLAETLGGLLFGRPVFDVAAVQEKGWETARRGQVLGRDVVCGTSGAFAAEVTEVCLDTETGVPLSLERAGSTYTAIHFGAPADESFVRPDGDGGG